MITSRLTFKVFFLHNSFRSIRIYSQVPSVGDSVRLKNNLYIVESLTWDIDSFDPVDTGYQAAVTVDLKPYDPKKRG